MAGTLFVVATPIGNLEDLTFRALRTLKEVDLIAAEDTRRTAKLLAHYAFRTPMVSLHEHNERRETPKLIERLKRGDSIALVSDAGTPGISDPGAWLVSEAHQNGLKVSPIPGPSAVAAALSASGFPASPFVFLGFPPRSGKAREDWYKKLKEEPRTVVFFEAPHRSADMVSRLTEFNRPITVNREITKYNEELVTQQTLATNGVAPVGEFVVVVAPSDSPDETSGPPSNVVEEAVLIFECLTTTCALDVALCAEVAAKWSGLDARAIRKSAKMARIARKQSEPRDS